MLPENDPAPDTGTSGEVAEDFDYRDGYSKLRPEYTRATQEREEYKTRLSEYDRLFAALHDSDPEVQRSAAEFLGLELDTGSPGSVPAEEEFVDPLEKTVAELQSEVTELRSARELEASERADRELLERRDELIAQSVELFEQNLTESTGQEFKFTQHEETVLGNLAIALEDERGIPDVRQAYNLLYGDDGFLETNRQRWIGSKKKAGQPPSGTSIPLDQRPKTRSERVNYVDQRVRSLEDQR